jgi:hypothetical protein
MAHNPVPEKKVLHMRERAAALNRNAARDERLACAVLELRQSIWDEIWHVARCWKVDPRELVEASRGGDL